MKYVYIVLSGEAGTSGEILTVYSRPNLALQEVFNIAGLTPTRSELRAARERLERLGAYHTPEDPDEPDFVHGVMRRVLHTSLA